MYSEWYHLVHYTPVCYIEKVESKADSECGILIFLLQKKKTKKKKTWVWKEITDGNVFIYP